MESAIKVFAFVIFVLFSLNSNAQTDLEKSIEKWEQESGYSVFYNKDFSSAFINKGCSYLGIFGENNYKINIRFDNVSKKSNKNYSVVGQSKLKNKIVSFNGEINIEHIEFYGYNSYEPISVSLIKRDI